MQRGHQVVKAHESIAAAVADAMADQAASHLSGVFTDDVRMRALLPGGPIEAESQDQLAGTLVGWFKDLDSVSLAEHHSHTVGDRLVVSYVLSLARGEHRWVVGQTAICALRDDGLVSAMDMVCSGYRHP